jgi:hypothetical protein
VLQASEAEPSIRHAVISIGALEMTSMSLRDVRKRLGARMPRSTMEALRDKRRSETEEHHLFALQQVRLFLEFSLGCKNSWTSETLIGYCGNGSSKRKVS